jgi:hypothetical protein
MLAAMRRASSRVSRLAAVRLPGSVSKYTYANACPFLSFTMSGTVVFDRPGRREAGGRRAYASWASLMRGISFQHAEAIGDKMTVRQGIFGMMALCITTSSVLAAEKQDVQQLYRECKDTDVGGVFCTGY